MTSGVPAAPVMPPWRPTTNEAVLLRYGPLKTAPPNWKLLAVAACTRKVPLALAATVGRVQTALVRIYGPLAVASTAVCRPASVNNATVFAEMNCTNRTPFCAATRDVVVHVPL